MRFNIIDIDYKESRGACWARHHIQKFYDNETYSLQLDSHHRFIKNWDEECIKMYKLAIKQGKADNGRLSDGEISVKINENVRG